MPQYQNRANPLSGSITVSANITSRNGKIPDWGVEDRESKGLGGKALKHKQILPLKSKLQNKVPKHVKKTTKLIIATEIHFRCNSFSATCQRFLNKYLEDVQRYKLKLKIHQKMRERKKQ